jgi:hypothetical protein
MTNRYVDPAVIARFDELIAQGQAEYAALQNGPKGLAFRDPIWVTRWTTSCFNLLDRLSVSTNRFVVEFERFGRLQGDQLNLALPLGVLEAARTEYERGFAVDYHLGVAATVFRDLLEQAGYLLDRSYYQAAAVLLGAALEEGLRSRARAEQLELGNRETLSPLIDRLAKTGTLSPFEADRLRAIAKLRNDAAHGGSFSYGEGEVRSALDDATRVLARLLGAG